MLALYFTFYGTRFTLFIIQKYSYASVGHKMSLVEPAGVAEVRE